MDALQNFWKDLTEFYQQKTYLEMPWFLLFEAFILLSTWLVAAIVNQSFNGILRISRLTNLLNTSSYHFIKHSLRAIIYVIGIMVAVYHIPALRNVSKSLLAGAGILALAIGLASQQALSNIISGLFIVVFKPFNVKDHLFIDRDIFGIVEDITLRHTILRTPENRRMVVPNSLISQQVIVNAQLNDLKICKFIEITIGYNEDVDLAMQLIQQIITNHPLCIDNRNADDIVKGKPRVRVKIIQLEESGIRLRAWAWTANNNDAIDLTFDMNYTLLKTFKQHNILILYPHRVLIFPDTYKNNTNLHAPPPKSETKEDDAKENPDK